MNEVKNVGSSTQSAYPWRTVLRTAIQNAPGILVALISVLTIVSEGYGDYLSENIMTSVTSLIAFLGTSQLVFTKIMADEKVDYFLTKFGLGTSPKSIDVSVVVSKPVEYESIIKFKEGE